MKQRANTISKKITQSLAYTAIVLLTPCAFAAQELVLATPEDTQAQAHQKLLKLPAPHRDLSVYDKSSSHAQQKLLNLPAPHRDLSVYDEGPVPVHYAQVADTLVIAPVQPSLPAPSVQASNPASQDALQGSPRITPRKKKAKVAKAAPAPVASSTVNDQNDQADKTGSSPFSLQHAAGLDENSRIQINGFLTVGGIASNSGAYYLLPDYGLVQNNFNFAALTRIGLQVTGNLAHNLAVVGQFVADGNTVVGRQNYNVTADWAYLRYTPRPEIQIRAGRFRLPTLFYSENAEVGYTYPWIILPNEVYGIDPITNLNGVSTISSLTMGQSNWTFKIQPFFGESSNQAVLYNFFNPNFVPGTLVNFSQNSVYGTAASIGNPYFEVRGSYMGFNTTITAPLALVVCPNGLRQTVCTLANSASSDFYSAGAKLDIDHFLLIGEYAHRNLAAIIDAIDSYYVMAAYSFRGFMPNITYAYAATTNNKTLVNFGGQFPAVQDSVTLGLNYTINSNLLAKISLSAIQPLDGTFGFFTSNPGRKTIMMYGVSLDAIF